MAIFIKLAVYLVNNLDNVRFVLIETSHPGNIGSVARAMKTQGIKNLYLVNPKEFPSSHATALATGGADILENAVVCNSMQEAIADCTFVIGTTARTRNLNASMNSSTNFADEVIQKVDTGAKVALVFGTESSGLSNSQLELCDSFIYIPTKGDFSSLNLSQAAQIIAYELLKARDNANKPELSKKELSAINANTVCSKEDLDGLLSQLDNVLEHLGITNRNNPKDKLKAKLRKIFAKAKLSIEEVNIIRGIWSATLKKSRD